jgi:WXXGXW repeat (2 copies)
MKKILLLSLGILTLVVLAQPVKCLAAPISLSFSVNIAPPPIPVYTQPICPGPGFIWTPGYWAYDPDNGYFWVPGTWVMAPQPGLLWTPGYWGWGGAAFIWHHGYWGDHIGFYGGIDYGHGYPGAGFFGGEWRGRTFYYNRAENNFGTRHFDHVYDHPVGRHFGGSRVSYNGGEGGLRARPGRGELQAEHERHFEATSQQHQHEQQAHGNRGQFLSVNHGRPEVGGTGRPGEFHGPGAVRATQAGGPVNRGQYRGSNPGHGNSNSRGPNPGGGGNHPVMTGHPNSRTTSGSKTRQNEPTHRAVAPQNQRAHEPTPRHENSHPQASSHPQQRRPEARPAQTYHAQGHANEAHHQAPPQHTAPRSESGHNEQHGDGHRH